MPDSLQTPNRRLSKADKLRVATLILMVGFALSVFVHYWLGAYCGYRYPYSTYLLRPGDTMFIDNIVTKNHCFGDLLAVCIHAENRDPYFATIAQPFGEPRPFPSNYFPFGAMLPYPLTLVPYPWAVGIFIAGFVALLIAFNWYFMRTGDPYADAISIAALTLMNYPAQVVIDRGNIEAIVFAFLAGFTVLLVRRQAPLSAACLGAAIAMKAVPVVFLPLCYRAAKRRGVGIAVATAAVLTLVSLLVMSRPVHISVLRLLSVLFSYSGNVAVGLESANHSSSLYGLFAIGAWFSQVSPGLAPIWSALVGTYSLLAAAILIGSMVACLVLPMKLWEMATVATVCFVLLPQGSPDYRLIHMMIPFALFVNSKTDRANGLLTTVLFSLLLVPKSFVVLAHETSLNSVLNPIIMIVLLTRTLFEAYGTTHARREHRDPTPPFTRVNSTSHLSARSRH
jgi:hypothetical protein